MVATREHLYFKEVRSPLSVLISLFCNLCHSPIFSQSFLSTYITFIIFTCGPQLSVGFNPHTLHVLEWAAHQQTDVQTHGMRIYQLPCGVWAAQRRGAHGAVVYVRVLCCVCLSVFFLVWWYVCNVLRCFCCLFVCLFAFFCLVYMVSVNIGIVMCFCLFLLLQRQGFTNGEC